MGNSDERAHLRPSEWSYLVAPELVPTGIVTLLLADIEASTRLWDSSPEDMTAAIAALDRTLSRATAAHRGVRPIEQGEGNSFVVAFARPGDAIACALHLQTAPLAPIRLRIGVHVGEVQLRDEANYVGPTINRAARLRDLAHGGQTVLSGTTADLVADRLPAGAWLIDLGTHRLPDLPRPERIMQLCHPDLHNEYPPLRAVIPVLAHNLPVQLTSFIGRFHELRDIRQVLACNRLVTLTGTGGIGKTRLAQHLSAQLATEISDGVWYVDLASISSADVVATTVARALGLRDQPGRSAIDKLAHWVGNRRMVIVLDNCEHILDACAALARAMLSSCQGLSLLATSREPLGVAGEVIWRVPPLPTADDAIELFGDRARLAQPDFRITADNVVAASEICRRLDGVPLAIELAAARVRTLSVAEILEGLHDRFRLLSGGARTAVQRQQTLRASADWSHALLTELERLLFRRLAVFMGGFDLEAARMVADSAELGRHQVLDQLGMLVDKSLVIAESQGHLTRYRLLETVRQYAQEKLGDSAEAEAIRIRHRDYYSALAATFETLAPTDLERQTKLIEVEIDNFRAAFAWSLDHGDDEAALALASNLYPLWRRRGRLQEGLAWFDAALAGVDAQDQEIAPAVLARALADRVMLDVIVDPANKDAAADALNLAREIGEPALLLRALGAWCGVVSYRAEAAEASFTEALDLARSLGDAGALSQLLVFRSFAALVAGDARAERTAAEEGRDIARATGDRFIARHCCWNIGMAHLCTGNLDMAAQEFDEVIADADTHCDPIFGAGGRFGRSVVLAFNGDTTTARATAAAAVEQAAELGDLNFMDGFTHAAQAQAALAAGDVAEAIEACENAERRLSQRREFSTFFWNPVAEVALASGNLAAARHAADDAVSAATGIHAAMAMTTRSRIAAVQGEFEQAERDLHGALTCTPDSDPFLGIADTLECLGHVVGQLGSHREAARLFGSAHAIRDRTGHVRFQIYDSAYQEDVAALRHALGDSEFEGAWAQGAALSTEEARAYAQRRRTGRKRPASGWGALTPAEREVVRLVCAGLANKDIAARLFVSPRTVQTHLTRIYRKLDVTSRVQLAREAAHHH
jgi:predicted ATPase/class 3 adenylate cyclase/DNA-binding CsgD family transcriptional regulator